MTPLTAHKMGAIWSTAAWSVWLLLAHSSLFFLIGIAVDLPFYGWYPTSFLFMCLLIGGIVWARRASVERQRPNGFTLVGKLRGFNLSSAERQSWGIKAFSTLVFAAISFYQWKIFSDPSRGFRVVPNHDAIHHATQISNILRWDSVTPEAMYADPSGPILAKYLHPGGFYPLGAMISQCLGLTPSESIYLVAAACTVVLTPLSIFGFGALIVKDKSRVAPVSLLAYGLSSALFILPFSPLSWGGITTLVAVSSIGFSLCLAIQTSQHWAQRNRTLFGRFLALLVLSPLAAIHTSEFLYSVTLLGLIWLSCDLYRPSPSLKGTHAGTEVSVWQLLALDAIVICFGLFWTLIERGLGLQVLSQLGDLTPFEANIPQAIGQIILFAPNSPDWTILPPLLILLALLSPTRNLNRHVKVIVFVHLFVVTCATLLTGRGPAPWIAAIGDVWYRQYARVTYLWVLPTTVLAAAAAYGSALPIGRQYLHRLRQGERRFGEGSDDNLSDSGDASGRRSVLAVAALTMVPVIAWSTFLIYREGVRSTLRFASTTFQSIGAVSDQDRRLGENSKVVRLSGSLLAEFNSGLGLWWSDHSVLTTAASYLTSDDTTASTDLLVRLAANIDDPTVIENFRQLGFRGLAVNERTLGQRIGPDPGQLEISERWQLVVRGDAVSVWEVAE